MDGKYKEKVIDICNRKNYPYTELMKSTREYKLVEVEE